MRFITEFELPEYYDKSNEAWGSFSLERKKTNLECGIGVSIANGFGWQNPVNGNNLHHRLEIEAFPADKWAEFKRRLFIHLGATGLYEPAFKDLIAELESFGKPSGDAIPSNPPIQQTDVKYYYDNLDGKVYKQDGNGQIDDITNQQLNK